MLRRTIVDLILSHYNGNDNDFFYNTLEVLKEFKEDCPELYEHIVFQLTGKIKIRPKREEPQFPSDMTISFEKAEEIGLTCYLVPQGLETRLLKEVPLPLHVEYPKTPREAHIDGDDIIIEFYSFGISSEKEKPIKSFRFKIADQGKTWDFVQPTPQPEIE